MTSIYRSAANVSSQIGVSVSGDNINALIFDLDGLLVSSEDVYRQAWRDAVAEQGFVLGDLLYNSFLGRTNEDCEVLLQEAFGAEFSLPRFRRAWRPYWHRIVREQGMPVKKGASELLSYLGEEALPAAVATSSDPEEAHVILAQPPLARRFAAVVTGQDVVKGKPDPEIFLKAAAMLGVCPQHCLVLEDGKAGIIAASRAGMRSIFVPDLAAADETVKELAVMVVSSLLEVKEWLMEEGSGSKASESQGQV